ncbi:hypothetical protein L0026_21665 [Pseudomonas aeruginosa]|uniref:hypothetical protein n=1 Tax=Pseudomonas aeruginosa TaxID=287 RepID=UPI001FFBDFA1|nr:hypothetical protein [Pseudomonas aeruginosa]UPG11106.1 hypothetical protein L0026_21665 [Pseudomonas aeruginosa]
MNKANECTCPSGDGSLVHPCPAHPAVEQADASSCQGTNCGTTTGDHSSECLAEAAAGQGWELKPGDLCGRDCPIHKISVEQAGGDERATLAHRSEFHQHLKECADEVATWPSYKREALTQPSPAQAEAERPEVVAYLFVKPDGTLSMDAVRHKPSQPAVAVMTVAQHERIDAARMSRIAKLEADTGALEWLRNTFKVHQALVEQAGCETIEQLAEQRDAALAEVERLRESKGDPVGSLEKCMKVMYERDEHAKRLEVALARVAEMERQEPVATVAKVPGEDWNSLDFHRDLQDMQPGTKLYAAPVAQAQQLNDLDKQCRDDVARALGLRPNQERGFAWSYLLASIKSCVKASGDSAQAQHSVPEGWKLVPLEAPVEMLRAGSIALGMEPLSDGSDGGYPITGQQSTIRQCYAAMLAAAPGKEGV